MCLNFSGFARYVFSCVWARLEFAVLVDLVSRLYLKLPCLFPFLFSFLVDTMPVSIFDFFSVDTVPFCLFYCFIPIRRPLTVVARDLALDVCFI